MCQVQMTFIIFRMIKIIAAIARYKLKLTQSVAIYFLRYSCVMGYFTNLAACHSILERLKIESNLQIHQPCCLENYTCTLYLP